MTKITEYTTLLKTKWLNLFSAKYDTGDGKKREWIFVSRNKSLSQTGECNAVVIVPFLDRDHVVLIRQFRVPVNDYVYEFPAGLISQGEDILTSAKRELEEETGLQIISSKTYTDVLYNSPGLTDENVAFVFAETSGIPSTSKNEATEDIEVLVLSRTQVACEFHHRHKFSAKCWLILKAFADGHNWI